MLRVLCLYMNKIQNLEAALSDMRRLPKVNWVMIGLICVSVYEG